MIADPPVWTCRRALACQAEAVQVARLHTRDILDEWRTPEDLIDSAELIVSELATNAVKYSVRPEDAPPGIREFVLTLWRLPAVIQIYVYDADRRPPVIRELTDDEIGGRGLHLVADLSDDWGYVFPNNRLTSGKAVWAELRLPDYLPGNVLPTGVRQLMPSLPKDDPMAALNILHELAEVARHGFPVFG